MDVNILSDESVVLHSSEDTRLETCESSSWPPLQVIVSSGLYRQTIWVVLHEPSRIDASQLKQKNVKALEKIKTERMKFRHKFISSNMLDIDMYGAPLKSNITSHHEKDCYRKNVGGTDRAPFKE